MVDRSIIRATQGDHAGQNVRTLGNPGWVTSLGALVALVFGAINYFSQNGQQIEAQRNSQATEQRLGENVDRIWNAFRADKDRAADHEIHLGERLRDEIKADLRREIDECACRAKKGGEG